MADPFTAFGTAASALQLADIALRASRETCNFLSALKNAGKETRMLRESLRDVESNIKLLRDYVSNLRKSKTATEEFEVLPEIVTRSLTYFHDDMVILKAILPPKPSPSLAQRIGWTYNKRRVPEVQRRLNERKSDLTLALAIVDCQHHLLLRESNAMWNASAHANKEEILRTQKESKSTIIRQTALINDHARSHGEDHAELLRHLRQVSNDIGILQKTDYRQPETAQHLAKHEHFPVGHRQAVQQACLKVESSKSQFPRDLREPKQSLSTLQPNLVDIESATTVSASNTDLLTRIIRSEIRSNLKPIIEQTSHRSESQCEARLRRVEAMIEQISVDLGQHISSANNLSQLHGRTMHTYSLQSHSRAATKLNHPLISHDSNTTKKFPAAVYTKNRRSWSIEWRIGSVQIDVQTSSCRWHHSSSNESTTSIYIHFRPSQAWVSLPGLSIFYSTAPNQHGFYMLAPMITTFPIIHDDHAVWYTMADGNVEEVRRMLRSGEVHPRSQDGQGCTLLHVSTLSTVVSSSHRAGDSPE